MSFRLDRKNAMSGVSGLDSGTRHVVLARSTSFTNGDELIEDAKDVIYHRGSPRRKSVASLTSSSLLPFDQEHVNNIKILRRELYKLVPRIQNTNNEQTGEYFPFLLEYANCALLVTSRPVCTMVPFAPFFSFRKSQPFVPQVAFRTAVQGIRSNRKMKKAPLLTEQNSFISNNSFTLDNNNKSPGNRHNGNNSNNNNNDDVPYLNMPPHLLATVMGINTSVNSGRSIVKTTSPSSHGGVSTNTATTLTPARSFVSNDSFCPSVPISPSNNKNDILITRRVALGSVKKQQQQGALPSPRQNLENNNNNDNNNIKNKNDLDYAGATGSLSSSVFVSSSIAGLVHAERNSVNVNTPQQDTFSTVVAGPTDTSLANMCSLFPAIPTNTLSYSPGSKLYRRSNTSTSSAGAKNNNNNNSNNHDVCNQSPPSSASSPLLSKNRNCPSAPFPLSPDMIVISGHEDGHLVVWNTEKKAATINHAQQHNHVTITNCVLGTSLMYTTCERHHKNGSCGDDDSITVWDLASMTVIATLSAHEDRVSCIVVCELDETKCFSGGVDKIIYGWDLSSATPHEPFAKFVGHSATVTQLVLGSSNANNNNNSNIYNDLFQNIFLISASHDGQIRMWDVAPDATNEIMLQTPPQHHHHHQNKSSSSRSPRQQQRSVPTVSSISSVDGHHGHIECCFWLVTPAEGQEQRQNRMNEQSAKMNNNSKRSFSPNASFLSAPSSPQSLRRSTSSKHVLSYDDDISASCGQLLTACSAGTVRCWLCEHAPSKRNNNNNNNNNNATKNNPLTNSLNENDNETACSRPSNEMETSFASFPPFAISSLRLLWSVKTHRSLITDVAVDRTNHIVAVTSASEPTVTLYQYQTKVSTKVAALPQGGLRRISLDPSKMLFVVGADNGSLCVFSYFGFAKQQNLKNSKRSHADDENGQDDNDDDDDHDGHSAREGLKKKKLGSKKKLPHETGTTSITRKKPAIIADDTDHVLALPPTAPVGMLHPHVGSISSMLLEVDANGSWQRLITAAKDSSIFILDFDAERGSSSVRFGSFMKNSNQNNDTLSYRNNVVMSGLISGEAVLILTDQTLFSLNNYNKNEEEEENRRDYLLGKSMSMSMSRHAPVLLKKKPSNVQDYHQSPQQDLGLDLTPADKYYLAAEKNDNSEADSPSSYDCLHSPNEGNTKSRNPHVSVDSASIFVPNDSNQNRDVSVLQVYNSENPSSPNHDIRFKNTDNNNPNSSASVVTCIHRIFMSVASTISTGIATGTSSTSSNNMNNVCQEARNLFITGSEDGVLTIFRFVPSASARTSSSQRASNNANTNIGSAFRDRHQLISDDLDEINNDDLNMSTSCSLSPQSRNQKVPKNFEMDFSQDTAGAVRCLGSFDAIKYLSSQKDNVHHKKKNDNEIVPELVRHLCAVGCQHRSLRRNAGMNDCDQINTMPSASSTNNNKGNVSTVLDKNGSLQLIDARSGEFVGGVVPLPSFPEKVEIMFSPWNISANNTNNINEEKLMSNVENDRHQSNKVHVSIAPAPAAIMQGTVFALCHLRNGKIVSVEFEMEALLLGGGCHEYPENNNNNNETPKKYVIRELVQTTPPRFYIPPIDLRIPSAGGAPPLRSFLSTSEIYSHANDVAEKSPPSAVHPLRCKGIVVLNNCYSPPRFTVHYIDKFRLLTSKQFELTFSKADDAEVCHHEDRKASVRTCESKSIDLGSDISDIESVVASGVAMAAALSDGSTALLYFPTSENHNNNHHNSNPNPSNTLISTDFHVGAVVHRNGSIQEGNSTKNNTKLLSSQNAGNTTTHAPPRYFLPTKGHGAKPVEAAVKNSSSRNEIENFRTQLSFAARCLFFDTRSRCLAIGYGDGVVQVADLAGGGYGNKRVCRRICVSKYSTSPVLKVWIAGENQIMSICGFVTSFNNISANDDHSEVDTNNNDVLPELRFDVIHSRNLALQM